MMWNNSNKKILIVFGYDFNQKEEVEIYTSLLSEKYCMYENTDIIDSLIFPDDFKHGAKSYSSDLYNYIIECEYQIGALIILGAPENTHIALGRLQDHLDMNVPFPVIALFPQDDTLGLESTCNLVIDKSQKVAISGDDMEEETESQFIEEAKPVLISTIDYILTTDGKILNDIDMYTHAERILKKIKFNRYTDPETNIQSVNHYMIQ